ncbi:MoxR-like ATPase [Kineococcus radiotolerans]|uniref:MoxR-like ATPase n=1 Tax=Kineococcus radiotolerans TaxID=131568 RepID=A0A7W4TIM5_KINRA|nr:MoxR family ATPase [Kineococcus radiotolerans]MBB2899617.1 MoxR-like ATPase [Kineococcus radiotolerans]
MDHPLPEPSGAPAPAPAPLPDPTAAARALVDGVERVVRGRRAAVELLVTAVLARGHVLVEDVPGSGKTTLATAFAASLGAECSRVQATADLLPADVTGSGVWDPASGGFRFVPGPLFAPVVLVDELNRTSPRTQSAFLEAMEERRVTVDGVRHRLPEPFVVVATQNPVEQHGTYPLPEGQLDRFAVRLVLGPLTADVERRVLREQLAGNRPETLTPVLDLAGLLALQRATAGVHVADATLDLAVGLTRATRTDPRVRLGAGTRAGLTLVRCAQARALLAGRDHVLPEDVQALVVPVLAHRLLLAEEHEPLEVGGAGSRTLAQERLAAGLVPGTAVPLHR